MRSKRILALIMIFMIAFSVVTWFIIIDKEDFLRSGEKTRTIRFDPGVCSYGYLYVTRDNRTPEASDWVTFTDNNDSVMPLSIDKHNPVEVELEIDIPKKVGKRDNHFKLVFRDEYNDKEYVKIVSFSS